jgi:MYXO-CTERM domain-containing protein
VVGDTYTFSANVANASDDDCRLVINSSGVAVEAQQAVGTTAANTLAPYSVSWTATSTGTVEVGIWSQGMAASSQILLDSAQLTQFDPTPTPEPSSMALAALGGIGMLTLIRRRNA